MTQLNTPYPATAYLTGFLRQHAPRLDLEIAQADAALAVPERHLGLVGAGEREMDLARLTDRARETLEGLEDTRILLLSGQPLNEPVVSHGPFVMNTQTQIMEAMRDYQKGKMGILIED